MKAKYLAVKDTEEHVLGIITYNEDNANTFAERVASCLEDNFEGSVTLSCDEQERLVSAATGYGEKDFSFSVTDEEGYSERECVYVVSVSLY